AITADRHSQEPAQSGIMRRTVSGCARGVGRAVGDSLCTEWRASCRVSDESGRSTRHRVRVQLVHELRDPPGAFWDAWLGRADGDARPGYLLRPTRHGSIRSGIAGFASDP